MFIISINEYIPIKISAIIIISINIIWYFWWTSNLQMLITFIIMFIFCYWWWCMLWSYWDCILFILFHYWCYMSIII